MSEPRGGFRPLRDLAAAFGFLTVLPVGREWPADGARGMVGYFPWVGALLGAEAAALAFASRGLVGADALRALLVGAIVVAAWALTTRLLHWDGLADTADGLGCPDDSRRLEVMRDSSVGAFGVAAIVGVALLQVIAAAMLVRTGALGALFVAPVIGRLATVATAWTMTPASTGGLGALVTGRPPARAVLPTLAAAALIVVLAWLTDPLGGVAVLLVGLLAGLLVTHASSRAVGGLSGDILGASILVTETAALLAAAFLLT